MVDAAEEDTEEATLDVDKAEEVAAVEDTDVVIGEDASVDVNKPEVCAEEEAGEGEAGEGEAGEGEAAPCEVSKPIIDSVKRGVSHLFLCLLSD